MSKLKIVTDSSCDLPANYFRDYEIGVVPINIRFGEKNYLEGETIHADEFYRLIEMNGFLPTTSQPSVGQFVERYLDWAKQGFDTILSIHVAGTLSGTLNSARLAAIEVADKIQVIPFDTLSGSAAMGFMCLEAAQLARLGKSADDILARLEDARRGVRIALTVATLKYAAMSGRISNIQALLASLLNIKPIIVLHDGKLSADERVRSRGAALERLMEMTRAAAGQTAINLAVIHSRAQSEAEQLLTRAKESLNVVDSFVGDITMSLAVHFGPGVLGTVVYPRAK